MRRSMLGNVREADVTDFWRHKSLEAMSADEWEALCDGCARCCLIKLADDDDGEQVEYTAVRCELLDDRTCRCTRYDARMRLVEDCVQVTPKLARTAKWLPATCAYRRLAEGKDLPIWHPLRSGDANSVFRAGIAIRGRTVSERGVHPSDLECMVVTWVQ